MQSQKPIMQWRYGECARIVLIYVLKFNELKMNIKRLAQFGHLDIRKRIEHWLNLI